MAYSDSGHSVRSAPPPYTLTDPAINNGFRAPPTYAHRPKTTTKAAAAAAADRGNRGRQSRGVGWVQSRVGGGERGRERESRGRSERTHERTPLLFYYRHSITITQESRRGPSLITQETRSNNVSIVARSSNVCMVAVAILLACLVITVSLRSLTLGFFEPPAPQPTYSVAIIGAGPAGIAAAQYLLRSPAARDTQFNITIFESKPVIGGMLAVHDSNGGPVFPNDDPLQLPITAEDIAGKALMWQNSLFTHDSEKLLGQKVKFTELEAEKVAYEFNGQEITSTIRPYRKCSLGTWGWLLWKYGASVYRAANLNQDGDLRKKMLEAPVTTDKEEIFNSLGVLEPLQQWADALLDERAISEQYRTEILEPQARRAFGYGLHQVTGFGLMLAAAQEDSANAYTGGHMIQQLERIVSRIEVPVRTSTRVVGIDYDWQQNQWSVEHESTKRKGESKQTSVEIFDKVILGTVDGGIRLGSIDGGVYNMSSFCENRLHDEMEGQPHDDLGFSSVYVTFFTIDTRLPSPFNKHYQVLFLNESYWGTYEVVLLREITSNMGTQYLYRVLSQSALLEELRVHVEISWGYQTKVANWRLIRGPLNPDRMPPFEWPVFSGLWWTSIIQQAWSTVDINWLAGKVVADDLIKQVTRRK